VGRESAYPHAEKERGGRKSSLVEITLSLFRLLKCSGSYGVTEKSLQFRSSFANIVWL
jgi:hypothetical protein